MPERLTYPEIKARYAPDWVLIGDPDTDEHLEILAGEGVLATRIATSLAAGCWRFDHGPLTSSWSSWARSPPIWNS